MKTVRTRFAPSPTGFMHVGGLRTALYCYLLAKANKGQFLLRIEDTDQNRLVPGAVENIIECLNWAGITFDEGPTKLGKYGPYVQSERLPLYKKHALELIEKDHAYYCFCSSERLTQVREQQVANKLPPAYDKHCRNLPKEEVDARLAAGEAHVIRMKVPQEGTCTINDLIRGEVAITYKNVDDQVLMKSDGFPTYHLAVVVDDHFMEISHVIRGEEWLPSTPKHLLLYQYFGWQAPQFAHLPLLLNPDKSKLSKRHGDVAVSDYIKKGYLPQALVNFIALLGWNPGDVREIFTLDELVKEFSLERVGKAGAVFNIEKLNWLNEQYIHKMPLPELLENLKPWLKAAGFENIDDEYVLRVIPLLNERITLLPDFVAKATYFFTEPDAAVVTQAVASLTEQVIAALSQLAQAYETCTQFDAATTEQLLRQTAETTALGAGKLIHPLRTILTGVPQGPSLFHLIEVLGRDAVVRRMKKAIGSNEV